MLSAYALYRLPDERQCFIMRQNGSEPLRFKSITDAEGRSGFVFAPFEATESCPLILIRPDTISGFLLDDIDDAPFQELRCDNLAEERRAYNHDFNIFHRNLQNGRFAKIVLSRRSIETGSRCVDARQLFKRACLLYPHLFVALVSTPLSGTWLMATPEILLEKTSADSRWHTIALAGTKIAADSTPWDDKNTAEQALVADYIRSCIVKYAVNIKENGPYTAEAGQLCHLKTDFMFSMRNDAEVLRLIGDLHPTPAVCGLPKQDTLTYILNHESSKREYYSGFAGLLDYGGLTRLYVTLRCMKIDGRSFHLYAGGGLLCGSTADKEWNETEIKMDTMRQCIATKQA